MNRIIEAWNVMRIEEYLLRELNTKSVRRTEVSVLKTKLKGWLILEEGHYIQLQGPLTNPRTRYP